MVCTKLAGIYFVFSAGTNLLNLFPVWIYSMPFSKQTLVESFALISSTITLIVQLVLALLILFHTGWIADKLRIKEDVAESPPLSLNSILRAGVILIGVYIFTTRIGGLVNAVYFRILAAHVGGAFAATQPPSFGISRDMITPGITLAFSLLLIFGSRIIVRIIGDGTKKEQETS